MFKGTYHHRVDAKGRLPIPAAFRRALGASPRVVVTLFDQCLAVYTEAEWARLESQLAALPAFGKQVKALTRLLVSRAADCDLDVQGRILLPPALRAAVKLERDAVVVGVLNRFEVWTPESWDAFVKESEALLDDVSLDIQWPPAPPQLADGGASAVSPPGGSGHPQAKPNS